MTTPLLFADLPTAREPVPGPKPLDIRCCVCDSPDWFSCAPGTASTAQLFPGSNIVGLRADDGIPTVAYCYGCDPLIHRGIPEVLSAADREFLSWSAV